MESKLIIIVTISTLYMYLSAIGIPFVSEWKFISTRTAYTYTIQHKLTEYPAKVDVQIKVNNTDGSEYIFSAFASSPIDDNPGNQSNYFGGVTYIYDECYVFVFIPGGHNNTGLAYTGGEGFDGPFEGLYTEGMVRIRAWSVTDFPPVSFSSYGLTLSSQYENSSVEVVHGLGRDPDYVIVQLYFKDGLIMEAEGATFSSNTSEMMSGARFAYNDSVVRVWAALKSGTSGKTNMFYRFLWYLYRSLEAVTLIVRVWVLPESQQDILCAPVLEKFDTSSSNGTVCNNTYSTANTLFVVQVKSEHLQGKYIFHGAGMSLTDGSLGKYGAVIFVYNHTHVLLWRPSDLNMEGFMTYVGSQKWGNGQDEMKSTEARVQVRVLLGQSNDSEVVEKRCSVCKINVYYWDRTKYLVHPTHIDPYANFLPNDNITYACNANYKHARGNLTITCLHTGVWNGNRPVCTYIRCDRDEVPFNTTTTYRSHTNFTNAYGFSVKYTFYLDSEVQYNCSEDYTFVKGNLTRRCMKTGEWSGEPPVCRPTFCTENTELMYDASVQMIYPSPGDRNNLEFAAGSKVKYQCAEKYRHIDGDMVRYCSSETIQWTGTRPVCTPTFCTESAELDVSVQMIYPFPDNRNNSEFAAGSNMTYNCSKNHRHVGGDLVRYCSNETFQWTGTPPVCKRCKCPCSRMKKMVVISNMTVLKTKIEATKKTLQIQKNNTSSHRRKKISATDSRPSSTAIGSCLGIGILAVFTVVVVFPDVPLLCRQIKLGIRA